MAIPDIPELATGKEADYTFNGIPIGDYVSEFEFDSERNVVEFEASNNTPTKRKPTGRSHSLTFTIQNHPTPVSPIEANYYEDPQPIVAMTATRGGVTKTYQVQVSHITDTGGSGDPLTYDIECVVYGDPT